MDFLKQKLTNKPWVILEIFSLFFYSHYTWLRRNWKCSFWVTLYESWKSFVNVRLQHVDVVALTSNICFLPLFLFPFPTHPPYNVIIISRSLARRAASCCGHTPCSSFTAAFDVSGWTQTVWSVGGDCCRSRTTSWPSLPTLSCRRHCSPWRGRATLTRTTPGNCICYPRAPCGLGCCPPMSAISPWRKVATRRWSAWSRV